MSRAPDLFPNPIYMSPGKERILPDVSHMSPMTRAMAEWYWHAPQRNVWLPGSGFEIYVRKRLQSTFVGEKNVNFSAIDIANIQVNRPGEGKFTRMIKELKEIKICNLLFLENVLCTSDRWQSRWETRLQNDGWVWYKIPGISKGMPKSFYLCLMDQIPESLLKDKRFFH